MFKTILVPTDGTTVAEQAAKVAVELAQALEAEIHAFTVIEPLDTWSAYDIIAPPFASREFYDAQREAANARLKKVHDVCLAANVPCHEHKVNAIHTWAAIVDYAQEIDADLIVIGSRGHRGFASWILGNQAERVLTHTNIPVLVIRA